MRITPLETPFLSVIIPVYNEEKRLPPALEQVTAFLRAQSYPAEVLVVDNGSTDRTLAVACNYLSSRPLVRILHEDQRGKGRAVRRGMLAAHGQYRFAADVDFSMPVEEINRFLPPQCSADIAIASREAPGAIRYHEPFYRHLSGRVFNLLIRFLLLPGLHDTQCGFKCFRAEVAEDLFSSQTLDGWTFDVEILAIARRRRYSIVEIPIPWYFNADSRVNVLRDSWRMFLDLLIIRRNLRLGVYDRRA